MRETKTNFVLFLYPRRGTFEGRLSTSDIGDTNVFGNIEGDYVRLETDFFEDDGDPLAPRAKFFYGKVDLQNGIIDGTWETPAFSKTEQGYTEQLFSGTWQVKKWPKDKDVLDVYKDM
jgi:hypothetical protein